MDRGSFPPGWEEKVDARTNKKFYVDHVHCITSWKDPRVEQLLPPGWERKSDRKFYYVDHVNKRLPDPVAEEAPINTTEAADSDAAELRPVTAESPAEPIDTTLTTETTDEIPNEFICPITLEIMEDPVMAEDGHTYERAAIESWFAGSLTSPKTNAQVGSARLIQNHALRSLIMDYKPSHV